MTDDCLAAQMYTVRAFTKTPSDIRSSLRKVRDIGYQAVQVSAFGPIDPAELAEIVKGLGLTICITHVSYERLCNDLPAVIAEHRLWGCPNVAISAMPAALRWAGEDAYRAFTKELNEIGRRLHEAGLTLSYHNHGWEFQRFGRRTGLDMIFDESDPRYLLAELDTYWIQYGGGDPAAWIRRMSGRMPVVHLKDMVMRDGAQQMAEIGEGNLNWPAILDACRAAGVRWYAVEQDTCPGDPFDSLAVSYRNLATLGLR